MNAIAIDSLLVFIDAIGYVVGAWIWIVAIVLYVRACGVYRGSMEGRYLLLLGMYVLIAYLLKGGILAANGMEGGSHFLIIAVFILILVSGFYMGTFVKHGGRACMTKWRCDVNLSRLSLSAYAILMVVACALSAWAADMVIVHQFGVLSRHAIDTEPMVAGIVVRIQDRVVPLVLMSLLICSVIQKAKAPLVGAIMLLLVAHYGVDAVTRLTKYSVLMAIMIAYIALGGLVQRHKTAAVISVGALAVAFPYAYSYVNYLRTDEFLGFSNSIERFFDRIVGAKESVDIISYSLSTQFTPLILRMDSMQPDTFYTMQILGYYGLHADAPGVIGYLVIEYGLVASFFVMMTLGVGFGIVFRLISHSRGYTRIVLFSLFVLETVHFMVDGNTALFSINESNARKVLVLAVLVYALIRILRRMSGRVGAHTPFSVTVR